MSNNIRSIVFLVDCICQKNRKENRDITKVVALSLSQNLKFSLKQSTAHKLNPSIYFLDQQCFSRKGNRVTKRFKHVISSFLVGYVIFFTDFLFFYCFNLNNADVENYGEIRDFDFIQIYRLNHITFTHWYYVTPYPLFFFDKMLHLIYKLLY